MIPKRFNTARNVLLLIFSLGFYAWGEPKFVLVMLLSIIGNYIFGLLIDRGSTHKKFWFIAGTTFNLGILFIFKYLNFAIRNINHLLSFAGTGLISQTDIALPIGISFFTFQALSYIIDVYRGNVHVQRNPLFLVLYISFFPQLIAGPIVRYADIEQALTDRTETVSLFREGTERFIIGLAKKVILANNLALIADAAFAQSGAQNTSVLMSWLGMAAYTLQIYFDSSGYSDMAIGLGKMFGFNFRENFRYPYISDSVSEFWRRWHISMGSWFRDYVYFPMGGSRVDSDRRLVFNLFIVWLLTGMWHGADWSFIFWRLMYFVLITFEKLSGCPGNIKSRAGRAAYRVFTMLMVMFGWVIFRADSLKAGLTYLASMFGRGAGMLCGNTFLQYFGEYRILLLFAVILSTPLINALWTKFEEKHPVAGEIIKTAVLFALLIISVSYIVLESYNPFIYFNF